MDIRKRNAGLLAFFLSGLCAMSSGVVVSLLQERVGFDYGTTGTLLALMNVGNLTAGFAAGVLPSKLGQKPTVLLLTIGYAAGYLMMGFTDVVVLLMLAFFLLGVAKGCAINTCTILVGNNSKNRTTGMNLMHGCYALGALLCPFLIAAAARAGKALPMVVLSVFGLLLWGVFATTVLEGGGKKDGGTDWSFLKSKRFWLLTGLIFCQNAAETSVSSWMVTYFKGSGIITAEMSPYTVTVMWTATLIARLLIAFVLPIKNAPKAMITMSVFCTIFYVALVQADTQLPALVLLFAFAFSMAGMNPTAVACAGRMTTVTSMGVMLPMASSGAIIMPWIIGLVADNVSIHAGMATNIIPCVGLLLFALAVKKLPEEAA